MKNKSLIAGLLLATMTALPAAAQSNKDYEPYPYNFISVQGGGQVTFTNCAIDKLATPIGAVSVGRFFTPAVGARLNAQGFNNKSGYKVGDNAETFKFKYVTTDLDLMFNLSNIICPKKTHTFNAILIGGVGLTYAWDNDEQATLLRQLGRTEPMAWKDDRLVHNFRIGMQFEVNVAKHWGINLEVAANNLHDRFNCKLNGNPDWQATAMLGLTYKFGFKKVKVAPAPAPAPEPKPQPKPEPKPVVPAPQPEPEPKPEPKPQPQPKVKEKTSINVFFKIASSKVTAAEEVKVAKLAEWLKAHPTAKVQLTAYADAGTGNATINKAISEKRAAAVKTMLINKYGIDSSRIASDYKGDTVQPFPENDNNRVVVGLAEEQ